GRGVATAAEIKFLTDSAAVEAEKPEVKKASNGAALLDRGMWTITADSEIKSVPITNVLDGDKNTFWHSFYTATGGSVTSQDVPPFTIEIDLKKKEKISGLIFTPRDSKAGIITKFDLYASVDGGEYKKLLEDKVLLDNTDEKEVLFKNNVEAGENKNAPTISFEEFFSEDSLERMVAIDKTDITVNCEAPFWASFKPGNIIDGNTNTFWQTEAGSDFVLSVDFNKVEKFGEIEYIPRNTADFHGFWLDFDIAVSVDGESWETVAEHYTLEKNLGVNKITLDKEVEARYVEIIFNKTVERRVSCAELTFYQTIAAKKQMAEKNKENYTLTIGSNIIEVYKNGESYKKEIDVAPYIVNGSTLIPLRGLMEEMGATVDWADHNQMIYIDNGVYYIEMQIWNKIVYVESQGFGRVRYALLNFPVIKDSRTFIPVRFVSEQLGYDVTWVAEEQKIIITKAV
ncbi:MAG: discoidin domain-containing protein, partial [Clostridia bacterium]|nr:discoidin domain-containing protein [Clostridia bacterium]